MIQIDQKVDSPLNNHTPAEHIFAAIDIGSNSFHLVISQLEHNEFRPLERLSEKVRLAADLDERNYLSDAAILRGINSLKRFSQRVKKIPPENIRIVGTNTLRIAKNSRKLMRTAEQLFQGNRIEIIRGREEARLIYLGVSHTLADDAGQRLVIDIGGGSTEFIIGERFEPILLESLYMGCIKYQSYFPNRKISKKYFKKAVQAAQYEVLNIASGFKKMQWHDCVGASGTFKAIQEVLIANNLSANKINYQDLAKLKDQILEFSCFENLQIPGLKEDRHSTYVPGLAISIGIMEALEIDSMTVSQGALREGVLYDMLGRISHEDVRNRTIKAIMARYKVDEIHGRHVKQTIDQLYTTVITSWQLDNPQWLQLLHWAADLHEIGLRLAHSSFHKHGAYILKNSDLPGFSHFEQNALSVLIRSHRRNMRSDFFNDFEEKDMDCLLKLCLLLRLSVIINHSRYSEFTSIKHLAVDDCSLNIKFYKKWLKNNNFILEDLKKEQDIWGSMEMSLMID